MAQLPILASMPDLGLILKTSLDQECLLQPTTFSLSYDNLAWGGGMIDSDEVAAMETWSLFTISQLDSLKV